MAPVAIAARSRVGGPGLILSGCGSVVATACTGAGSCNDHAMHAVRGVCLRLQLRCVRGRFLAGPRILNLVHLRIDAGHPVRGVVLRRRRLLPDSGGRGPVIAERGQRKGVKVHVF